MKPSFYVKFEPIEEEFDKHSQAFFLQQVEKFASDTKMKARMLDEQDTTNLKPGINIVVTVTGSLSPNDYSQIIDSFIKVFNKTYPKLIMERVEDK